MNPGLAGICCPHKRSGQRHQELGKRGPGGGSNSGGWRAQRQQTTSRTSGQRSMGGTCTKARPSPPPTPRTQTKHLRVVSGIYRWGPRGAASRTPGFRSVRGGNGRTGFAKGVVQGVRGGPDPPGPTLGRGAMSRRGSVMFRRGSADAPPLGADRRGPGRGLRLRGPAALSRATGARRGASGPFEPEPRRGAGCPGSQDRGSGGVP